MGRFTGPLRLEEVGYELWAIIDGFEFYSDTGIIVPIEPGFRTDLASVPHLLGPVVPKIGYWSQPAAVHDKVYRDHREGRDTKISRMTADRLLLEGMRIKAKEYKVPDIDRRDWLIFGGVVAAGENTWMNDEEREEYERKQREYADL